MSWAPTTRAARDSLGAGESVVAACCRRTVLASMVLVTPSGDEVCDACVAQVQRNGGLVDLYTQLGAPQTVLDAIFAKYGGG